MTQMRLSYSRFGFEWHWVDGPESVTGAQEIEILRRSCNIKLGMYREGAPFFSDVWSVWTLEYQPQWI